MCILYQSVCYFRVWKSWNRNNISSISFVQLNFAQPCLFGYFGDFTGIDCLSVLIVGLEILTNFDNTWVDTTQEHSSKIRIGRSLGYEHWEGFLWWNDWFRNVLDDAFQNTFDAYSLMFQVFNSPSVFAWSVINWIVKKMIFTLQIAKHFKNLVHDFTHSCTWSIDLKFFKYLPCW